MLDSKSVFVKGIESIFDFINLLPKGKLTDLDHGEEGLVVGEVGSFILEIQGE